MGKKQTKSQRELFARKNRLFDRAQKLANQGRWKETIAVWENLLKIDINDPQIYANYALSLANIGESVQAIDAYTVALRLGLPEDEVLAGVGAVFLLKGKNQEACENLELAVAHNPQNIKAWQNLMVAYSGLDQIEKAISNLGYQANETLANSEAYESLPVCCKIGGMEKM